MRKENVKFYPKTGSGPVYQLCYLRAYFATLIITAVQMNKCNSKGSIHFDMDIFNVCYC